MEKFDPVDIEFLINSAEVKVDAKKVKDELRGIGATADEAAAKVGGKGGKGGITPPLDAAGDAAERAGKKAAKARPQWNGLGNSINQLSRELPAFTYSAQTGFLALSNNIPILADEIGRLKAQNEALVASGKKGIPIWRQVLKNLGSWNVLLSLAIAAITIYGDKIAKFFSELFQGKDAIDAHKRSVEALNKAYESSEYQNTIRDLIELRSQIKLAKQGFIDKKDALDKYNTVLGDAYKKTDDLNEAERILVEKAPALIESMLYKTAATQAAADAAKALADNQKKQFETSEEISRQEEEKKKALEKGTTTAGAAQGQFTNLGASTAGLQIRKLQDELEELKKEAEKTQKDSSKIVEDLNRKAAEIAKAAGLDIFGEDENKPTGNKIVNQRKKLLQKIADLDREFAQKRLDEDKAELDALREKFDKVRALIEEFNKDPKNKANKIDVTGLGVIQENAEADLIYKQDTRKLEEEITRQKKLYQEIEEYKTKFGLEKTKERYGAELAEFENFAALLKQEIENNQDAFAAVDNGTATDAQQDRVKLLQLLSLQEKKLTNDKYIALLEEFQTYQQKRKLLTEQFQKEYQALLEQGNTEEAAVRKEAYEEELADLDDANLKKKDAYKALFEDVSQLTIKEGKRIIADAKKIIETQQMSAEAKAKILKLIADTEAEIEKLKEERIYKIASSIAYLGETLNALGNETSSPALSNIGSFLSSLASGLTLLQEALEAEEDMDKILVAVEATARIINMIANAATQRRAAEEAYYRSVIGFQNDYNLGLQEQIRLQSILAENAFITDYEGRITDALAGVRNANSELSEAIEELEDGRVKTGQRNRVDWGNVASGALSGAAGGAAFGPVGAVIGGIAGAIAGLFGGGRREDTWGNLLDEYPELLERTEEGVLRVNEALAQSLLENDMLDEATQQIVQNVLDWQQALEDARAQIRQVITDLTGSLDDDLRNALVDAFKSGEDAAVAMGDTVEKVLENILSNLIFNRIFSDAFTRLEDQMANSFDVGGDGNWVDDFSRFFDEASGLTDDFNQALRDARDQAGDFGFDIFQPEESDNTPGGLAGAIRRELTEETGSELTGLFRGQFDITKRHFQLAERTYELDQRHYEVSTRILQEVALIQQNTAGTVVQLKYAVEELKKINNDGSASARDMGRG